METAKNILVLTGSPRPKGNSDMMADAFIAGAQEKGHHTTRFNTGRMKINGCMACKKCFSKGKACIYDDDFNTIAPPIEQADALVFITPLYWYTFPAQLKAAIDKMYSLFVAERPLHISEAHLLVCGETDQLGDFDGIVKSFQEICKLMKWKSHCLIVPNVNEKGDILTTGDLDRVKLSGLSV